MKVLQAYFGKISRIIFDKFRIDEKVTNRKVRRIGIYRPGSIGDIIVALPVIQQICSRNTNAQKIVIFLRLGVAGKSPILSLSKMYHNVEVFDCSPLARLSFLFAIRRCSLDIFYDLRPDYTSFFTSIRNLILVRYIGSTDYRCPRLATKSTAIADYFDNAVIRESSRLFQVLNFENTTSKSLYRPFADFFFQTVASRLTDLKLPDRYVVIAPFAKRPSNQWPLERFLSIADWLKQNGESVVFIGDRELDYALGKGFINLCGHTDINEAMCIVSKATMIVSNDSGPLHIGTLFEIPFVAIFSQRDYSLKWYPPPDLRGIILKSDTFSCAHCLKETCHRQNACLTEIFETKVKIAIETILHGYKEVDV